MYFGKFQSFCSTSLLNEVDRVASATKRALTVDNPVEIDETGDQPAKRVKVE